MASRRLGTRCVLVTALLLIPAWAQATQGSPSAGKNLFTGRIRFQNGGPACASCHSVASIPFPNGGTLGPDLTQSYAKFSPDGVAAILQTLFFPTMVPLFNAKPLTTAEQLDLAAFFKAVAQRPPPAALTLELAAIALAALLLLLAVTWLAGRRRVRSVRRALVERATASARRGS